MDRKSFKYPLFLAAKQLPCNALPHQLELQFKNGAAEKDKKEIFYTDGGTLRKIKNRKGLINLTFLDSQGFSKVVQIFSHEEIGNYDDKKGTVSYEFNKNNQELIMLKENWAYPKRYKVTPCGCKPLQIIQGNDTTRYEYTRQGMLSYFQNSNKQVLLTYNKIDKMASILVKDNNQDTLEYSVLEYDRMGQLVNLKNIRGTTVSLGYNDNGKIVAMRTINRASNMTADTNTLEFSYNNTGKPTVIKSEKGEIRVQYDQFGEIANVENVNGGHGMALRVTQSFQALLKLMKPIDIQDLIDTDFALLDSIVP